jgi:hypothetical protein
MHTQTSGSAATMLALSLTCCIWPSVPSAQRVAAPGMETTATSSRPAAHPRVHADAVPDRFPPGSEASSALYEIPDGRATVHWLEYLEFMRATVPQTQSDVFEE